MIKAASGEQPQDPDAWEIYYDDESGHPYYYNKHTHETQWENPFGMVQDKEEEQAELYDSWQLYETFEFRGVFDDLTIIRNKAKLPRSGPNTEAMVTIAKLANTTFDAAQAMLEIAIFKAEKAAYGSAGVPTRENWSRSEAGRLIDVTEPPPSTTPTRRVALAGAWNDLGNIWYARGEWELTLDCFRKSLFWNPEQTSTLLNMAGVLVKLGFERDAAVVIQYYDDVNGGTMGGWHPQKEAGIRNSIQRGLELAQLTDGAEGRTRGELQLLGLEGIMPPEQHEDDGDLLGSPPLQDVLSHIQGTTPDLAPAPQGHPWDIYIATAFMVGLGVFVWYTLVKSRPRKGRGARGPPRRSPRA